MIRDKEYQDTSLYGYFPTPPTESVLLKPILSHQIDESRVTEQTTVRQQSDPEHNSCSQRRSSDYPECTVAP